MFRTIVLSLVVFNFVTSFSSRAQSFSYEEYRSEKDSIRLREMGLDAWSYFIRNNVDSLKLIGTELTNSKFHSMYPVGLINMGSYHIRTNDIPKGIELLQEARDIFSREKSIVLLSETETELGNAYFLKGDYNLSSRYYFASMVHGANLADLTASYNGMIGFGKTICATGDTIQGVRFVREYLERCLRDEKFESASDACGFLGMIAGLDGKTELMSAYYRRGNVYAGRSDSKAHLANAYTNKAIDFFTKSKIDSAEILFKQALDVRKKVGASQPITEGYYNLAILNIETGKFDEAQKYALLGEKLSEEAGILSWQLDCLLLLKEIAENQKRFEDIEPIQVEIDRIRAELDLMGNVDGDILSLAVEFTSLEERYPKDSRTMELTIALVILGSCGILFVKERVS